MKKQKWNGVNSFRSSERYMMYYVLFDGPYYHSDDLNGFTPVHFCFYIVGMVKYDNCAVNPFPAKCSPAFLDFLTTKKILIFESS